MPIYEEVREHIDNKNIKDLKNLINESDSLDITKLISQLSPEEQVIVFRLLEKEKALEIFEMLDVDLQQELISSFKENRAVELFSGMEPDDRARLLDELPARVAKKLLASLTLEDRKKTAELLGYPPETAGRIMTPEYISLKRNLTVKMALEAVKRNGQDKETVYTLYVTDATRKLEGVVSLKELIMASEDSLVEDIMTHDVISVNTNDDQEDVARLLQERGMLAVPVVDKENRLVGIITVDDAMDILEEETTEDIYDKVGLATFNQAETGRSQTLIKGSIFDVWKVRIPFLVLTLIGGLLAGVVIEAFEATLEAIAAVAIFIPVIMDMGGNVGTQSSTIFTRAFVLGHITARNFFKYWVRETGIGFSIGLILGTAACIITATWQQNLDFGFAVGLSLLFTVTLASTLGFLIPYFLAKLGFDQAAGSVPILTSIKDISGLFIYFTMVSFFLGYML